MRTCFAAAILLMLASPPASALTIHIDAQSLTASHNAGGAGILIVNGALTGLDYPGDWASYHLAVTEFGVYGVTVRCWGINGYPYTMRLIVKDVDENEQSVDIVFVGRGTCGS